MTLQKNGPESEDTGKRPRRKASLKVDPRYATKDAPTEVKKTLFTGAELQNKGIHRKMCAIGQSMQRTRRRAINTAKLGNSDDSSL